MGFLSMESRLREGVKTHKPCQPRQPTGDKFLDEFHAEADGVLEEIRGLGHEWKSLRRTVVITGLCTVIATVSLVGLFNHWLSYRLEQQRLNDPVFKDIRKVTAEIERSNRELRQANRELAATLQQMQSSSQAPSR